MLLLSFSYFFIPLFSAFAQNFVGILNFFLLSLWLAVGWKFHFCTTEYLLLSQTSFSALLLDMECCWCVWWRRGHGKHHHVRLKTFTSFMLSCCEKLPLLTYEFFIISQALLNYATSRGWISHPESFCWLWFFYTIHMSSLHAAVSRNMSAKSEILRMLKNLSSGKENFSVSLIFQSEI